MTTLYRYKAIPNAGSGPLAGEITAESAAAGRAQLRKAGLRVLDIRPVHAVSAGRIHSTARSVLEAVSRHLRARRGPIKAELYDSLATMLDSGLPLLESLQTLAGTSMRARSSRRRMLVLLREDVRAGAALASAMRHHPGWFDVAECAMIEAGQHAGTLPAVLRRLAHRLQRTGELTARLTSALAYPMLVAAVGFGVVIFLSTQTLPQLALILQDAQIPLPRLTAAVMWAGQLLAAWGWLAAIVAAGTLLAVALLRSQVTDQGRTEPLRRRDFPLPRVVREIAVARAAGALAELAASGVPIVEALRVVAPTVTGPGSIALRARLLAAAACVEHGSDLAAALAEAETTAGHRNRRLRWFDEEFRRLISIGEAAGELDSMLDRLAERYERRARRAVDRFAAALEPIMILVLAALIGLVVMAAVLPLIRLQEVH